MEQLNSTIEIVTSVHNDAGTNVAADSTPTVTLYQNGTIMGSYTAVNMTSSVTGVYKYSLLLTDADFAIGDYIRAHVTVVVDSVTTTIIADSFLVVDFLSSTSDGVKFADEEDVYPAYLDVTIDGGNTQDEYTVTWYKNGVLQTSGITSPTITVVKRADGTDLIATTAMTQIGSTGSYKYDETTNRLTEGEAALVTVAATMDGSARTWRKVVSRDS